MSPGPKTDVGVWEAVVITVPELSEAVGSVKLTCAVMFPDEGPTVTSPGQLSMTGSVLSKPKGRNFERGII